MMLCTGVMIVIGLLHDGLPGDGRKDCYGEPFCIAKISILEQTIS
jgi:hypothetical protein